MKIILNHQPHDFYSTLYVYKDDTILSFPISSNVSDLGRQLLEYTQTYDIKDIYINSPLPIVDILQGYFTDKDSRVRVQEIKS